VTGGSSTSRFDHAFLYSNGQMIDLGTLGGDLNGEFSVGVGINDAGQVTGRSSTSPNSSPAFYHAFLYSNGQMFDLNDLIDPALGLTLLQGEGINDNGQIVANGFVTNGGGSRAYLLTPTSVPEPRTWAVVGIPLLALFCWRYRWTPKGR